MSKKKSDGLLNSWLRDMRHKTLQQAPPIRCADGFKMSVQASVMHYCTPASNYGPWTHVEVGYPSEQVEEFAPYGDSDYSKVYAQVPIGLVEKVIQKHGGWSDDQQLG